MDLSINNNVVVEHIRCNSDITEQCNITRKCAVNRTVCCYTLCVLSQGHFQHYSVMLQNNAVIEQCAVTRRCAVPGQCAICLEKCAVSRESLENFGRSETVKVILGTVISRSSATDLEQLATTMLLFRGSSLLYYCIIISLAKTCARINPGSPRKQAKSFPEHASSSSSPIDGVEGEGINCRVPVTLKCQYGERSCQNRCGKSVKGEQIKQFYCQCDNLCSHFQDCCYDYKELCLCDSKPHSENEKAKNISDAVPLNTTVDGCVTLNTTAAKGDVTLNSTRGDGATLNTVGLKNEQSANDNMRHIYACVPVRGYIRVYLIDVCHIDFEGTALERKCQTYEENELLGAAPSYDPMTQQHYKNINCAKCNYVQKSVMWKMEIKCDVDIINIKFLESFDFNTVFGLIKDRLCHLEYFEPNGSALARPCIDTLYGNGGTCMNETVGEKCVTYGMNPVADFFEIYHNVYCWQSRQWHDYPILMAPESHLCYMDFPIKNKNDLTILRFYSFEILIDVLSDNDRNIIVNPLDPNLGEGVWKCDGRAGCSIKRCPIGFQKVANKCTFKDTLINVTVNVHFKQKSFNVLRDNIISASYLISIVYESLGPAWPAMTNMYTGKIPYKLYVPLGNEIGILANITDVMDKKFQNLQRVFNETFSTYSMNVTYSLPPMNTRPHKTQSENEVGSKDVNPKKNTVNAQPNMKSSYALVFGTIMIGAIIGSFIQKH
ncbi:unnamed protein product [Owenia fusiformis]|uniref:SMB domain-containing protein n=1 Tax=Owenia fusiformis TaxID=6347 RepID=A0A8S4N826_OWEFU|nr:unnamed protein product [Owenia fusiformis]